MMLIQTTRGPMEEALLDKRIVTHERSGGQSVWTEYYADFTVSGPEGDGELVKRDVAHRKYSIAEMQEKILKEQQP